MQDAIKKTFDIIKKGYIKNPDFKNEFLKYIEEKAGSNYEELCECIIDLL